MFYIEILKYQVLFWTLKTFDMLCIIKLLISWGHWVVVYLFKRVSVVSESHRLATRAVNLCYYNPVCYWVNFKEISSSLKQFLWQFRRIFPSSLHLCVAVSKQTMSCDYCYLTNTDVRTLWEILWLYPPVHLIMIVETFYGKWIFLCKSMSTLRWCGTLWCCTALFDFQTSIADNFGWIVLASKSAHIVNINFFFKTSISFK